jgi:hypothetical protein
MGTLKKRGREGLRKTERDRERDGGKTPVSSEIPGCWWPERVSALKSEASAEGG